MNKNTQIILAIGAVGVAAYAVNKFAVGANGAIQSAGTGAEIGLGGLGIGGGLALIALAIL